MPHTLTSVASALLLFGLTNASCILHNKLDDLEDLKADGIPAGLCTPGAGDGEYQFGMTVSEVSVPTFDSDNALAGITGSTGFVLFDSECVPLGAYGPDDEGNDCGVPYEIDYFPDRPVMVSSINWDVGNPSFGFDFDGTTYRSGGEECGGCSHYFTDGGLRPVQECKCSFYAGTCTLQNIQDEPMEYPETKDALCTPQDSGNYQLSLDTRFSTISLYDSECHSVATYRASEEERGPGCALPLKIDYFGDDKIIMVRNMELDAYVEGFNTDSPAFTFEFNGRSYGSTDDWCGGCAGQGSDDELNQGCRCGFYVGE